MNNSVHAKIGFWTLTMLVTGNLVGSGAFMLPASLSQLGSISIVGWVVTAFAAIVLSFMFATLSKFSDKSGGPQAFIQKAYGNTAGFIAAWGYWVLSWISNAGLVIGAVGYFSPLVGGFSTFQTYIVEISLIVFLSFVNLTGIKNAGRFEVLLTLCKVVPLILLPIFAFSFIKIEHFTPINNTSQSFLGALNSASFMALWCFVGLETATVPSGDVENPRQNIPKALIFGTVLAALIYILGTVSIMGVIPKEVLVHSKAPYADLAGVLFGGSWSISISLLASIACIGALNGWIMIVSRISSNAAEDGLFPKFFATLNKSGAPKWGTIISTFLTIIFMGFSLSDNLLDQFNIILDLSVMLILVIYVGCAFSYRKLLLENKQFGNRQKSLFYFSLLFCLWALSSLSFKMTFTIMAILVAGLPMYYWTKKQERTNGNSIIDNLTVCSI